MARDESDREDLLREATALVERIELVPKDGADDQHIVAGFRRDGALSVFFGEEPVYQFNAAGALRRAYSDGKLLKALHGQLVALQRVRTELEVQLIRHELAKAEQTAFLSIMSDRMRMLATLLSTNEFEVAGQVSQDSDVLGRIRRWLAAHSQWTIANQPNA
jgi:hypothetical protein